MANIRDAEDAFLGANAEIEELKATFLREWYAPMIDSVAMALWADMPEGLKAEFRKITPDAARDMDDLVGGKNAYRV